MRLPEDTFPEGEHVELTDWMLDLARRALQVCREPEGDIYLDTVVFRECAPVSVKGQTIEVAALLPRA